MVGSLDIKGNLESETHPRDAQVTYSYHNMDRPTEMHDFLGTTTYGYDAAGRITGFALMGSQ